MKAMLNRVRLLKIFYQVVKNPEKTELIFSAVEILTKSSNQAKTIQEFEDRMTAVPSFKKMHDENYTPQRVTLAELSQLPKESFGFALYSHIVENQLDWNLFPKVDLHRPIDYLTQRIYQDHDLWHVLMGYSSQLEDELALQAFAVAQYGSPLACVIIAGGLLHLLAKDPKRAVCALGRVADGYRRGQSADFLLGLRLYDGLDRPLTEMRDFCHIPPQEAGQWRRTTPDLIL